MFYEFQLVKSKRKHVDSEYLESIFQKFVWLKLRIPESNTLSLSWWQGRGWMTEVLNERSLNSPKFAKKKSYSFSLSRLKWNCVNLTQTFDFLRNYLNHWRLTLLILLCAITSFEEIRVCLLTQYERKINLMYTLFGWGCNFQFCIPITDINL